MVKSNGHSVKETVILNIYLKIISNIVNFNVLEVPWASPVNELE